MYRAAAVILWRKEKLTEQFSVYEKQKLGVEIKSSISMVVVQYY